MIHEFQNPSAKFRGKPFWAWNGNLNGDEIRRQVDVMKEMGFGGFFMHSRVGLETEYLSNEWFELINQCADYAQAQGLEAWLYDEDRYPSGSAGGIATQAHEYRAKYIRVNFGPFEWSDRILAAFSCKRSGISITDVRRLSPGEKPVGDILWFDIFEAPEDPNYNGSTYLDTMNRAATDEFLRTTHEKYADFCAERLGTSIKGIFTDEPERGEIMLDSIRSGVNMAGCTPYTESLFEEFEKMWGYDLLEKLPQLFFQENGQMISQVKWHYCETIQQLFFNNFLDPIVQWCDENRIKLTGHMLHEDTLSSQTIPNGSLMRNYERMHSPGIDALGRNNQNYHIVKQLSSVARQTGKTELLSELYGCSGWQMSFEDYKHAGDWQALLGINLRCPHLSWYTMAGENKRDYPASIFFQSAWYREYRYLEDYYARLAVFASAGDSCCDTLVISPVESMWCSIYIGWSSWLRTKDPALLELETSYEKLCRELLEQHVEFDYGDEEMLSRLGTVENGRLRLGKVSYQTVILPAMLTIRGTTLAKLRELEASGGHVVFSADGPSYVDALPCPVKTGSRDLSPVWNSRVLGLDNPRIFSSVKKDDQGDYYVMLLNRSETRPESTVFAAPDGFLENWNPETGETRFVERPERITLNPGEMRLYRITGNGEKPPIEKKLPEISLPEHFTYSTDEPNVLVLDQVICKYDGQTFTGDVLKADRAIRDVCGIPYRGGSMYQPWYLKKKGIHSYFPVELKYQFESNLEFDGYLAVEQPERAELTFNGVSVHENGTWWVDPCFRKIPVSIRKGNNVLVFRTMYADDTVLEAVHVLGEFGVFQNRIGPKPQIIHYGDIRPQGFPYYGGKIRYHFEKNVTEPSCLRLNGLYGAGVIKVNNTIVPWAPYVARVEPCQTITVELVLTRRNTFGPLHYLPAVPDGLSPACFVPEGEHQTDSYVTLPCGLERTEF